MIIATPFPDSKSSGLHPTHLPPNFISSLFGVRIKAELGRIHPYLPPLGEKLLAVDGDWGWGRKVTFLWDRGHWEGYPCFIG